MKNIAIGVLVVILASILLEPLVELLNLGRENIILGTALSNSARSARDRSLEYEFQRNLDAKVNEDKFAEYFSDAFEAAMNVTRKNPGASNTELEFRSNDGKYNDFTVKLDFDEKTDPEREQVVTKVTLEAVSDYKFKTKYLKLAAAAGEDVDYQLKEERVLVLTITN
ncbi:hypothetical protein P4H42_07980 [Paenibacillus macerans]|uniref:hypothetical protein n=1 Tax=Paenibacillus macerans TaxID=44252 RepID=UPI002DB6FBF5|nr:hypothetical protein [Paenibacillus macerans]MEC0329559.1 hypothetical protein [Paenibacillus macerans]MED4956081.1 hypothetical protein [Paenibacillus macerans]